MALIQSADLAARRLLNAFLVSIGMERVLFFLNANWAVFSVISISIWAQMGFYMLILLAGLAVSIPEGMYAEAADMDGANRWQSFRGITLPLLMPTLLVVLVLSVIRAVQVSTRCGCSPAADRARQPSMSCSTSELRRVRQPDALCPAWRQRPPSCWAWCCSCSRCFSFAPGASRILRDA
ncbi:MAG: sugar ABC transporter permease [Caldilineaceae bacterium]|nr:sugar ABC transporter permease [Caldilineaceae bacterium]